jgi:tryptophanyl-tRNA synthetase
LLAGTRLTGSRPHLGTLYGWIRPIAEAAAQIRVHVLIADLQSLDVPRTVPIHELADELEDALARFLPRDVPIVRESSIRWLPQLALLAAPLFGAHHMRRIAPLRKLARIGEEIPVSTLLYPAMMIADVLAFGATHVLAKPEGRFQHSDVLNDVLSRGAHRYGWPRMQLAIWAKARVDVLRADGTGPMKRNQPGILNVPPATGEEIRRWTTSVVVPGYRQPASERSQRCRVVWPVWQAIGMHGHGPEREDLMRGVAHGCSTNQLSCQECTARLADVLADDLRPDPPRCRNHPRSLVTIGQAEARAMGLARLATVTRGDLVWKV